MLSRNQYDVEEQIPLPHFSRRVEDDPYGAGQGQGADCSVLLRIILG
jgi:hypothetical protein